MVAALTMPVLMAQHRKTVVETRLKKFYSSINQAIQMSEATYGDKKEWDAFNSGYENDADGNPDTSKPNALNWFNKYLKPYIQYTDLKTYNDLVQIYFADGSMLLFRPQVWVFFPESKNWKGELDNFQSGKQYFSFLFAPSDTRSSMRYHYSKGVEPYTYDWDGDIESLKNDTRYGCNENVTDTPAYCTKLIQINGWKIPDDYPFKL